MTDEKLRDQLDRGQRSALCMQELTKAMEALERDCFDAFKRSDIHDDRGRTTCRLYLKVLEDVRIRFTTAITTGEAARKELIRVKEPSKLRSILSGR